MDSKTTKPRPTKREPLPGTHEDIALADLRDVRAITRMGSSWIHDRVKAGLFPAPVIREPRCTRWRLSDVRAWVNARIEEAQSGAKQGGQA